MLQLIKDKGASVAVRNSCDNDLTLHTMCHVFVNNNVMK